MSEKAKPTWSVETLWENARIVFAFRDLPGDISAVPEHQSLAHDGQNSQILVFGTPSEGFTATIHVVGLADPKRALLEGGKKPVSGKQHECEIYSELKGAIGQPKWSKEQGVVEVWRSGWTAQIEMSVEQAATLRLGEMLVGAILNGTEKEFTKTLLDRCTTIRKEFGWGQNIRDSQFKWWQRQEALAKEHGLEVAGNFTLFDPEWPLPQFKQTDREVLEVIQDLICLTWPKHERPPTKAEICRGWNDRYNPKGLASGNKEVDDLIPILVRLRLDWFPNHTRGEDYVGLKMIG